MKQIAILFVLIILTVASSGKNIPYIDLLKSISKFSDGGDLSGKFAKSSVSPFSEAESEEYDDDDEDPPKGKRTNDDDDGVDVMAQLKSYQQKLSTTKDVKQNAPKKIEESESEYDYDEDDDDSGNMWSRGISKKLQKQETPVVMPISVAKEQISNDYKQFTSLKMPEPQTKQPELQLKMPEIQTQSQKVTSDDGDKERSSDFESKKQAQLEKYNRRFHVDEPKESKSIYEDDSLKQFMPKINFQPINIQEIQKPAPQESKKVVEVEDDEEEEVTAVLKNKPLPQKQTSQNLSLDAFDLFKENKGKPQQQSNKKIIEETETQSEDDEYDEEIVVKKVSKKNKQKKAKFEVEEEEEEELNQKKIEKEKEKEKERQRQELEQEEMEKQRKNKEKERQLEEQRQEQLRQQQLLEQQEQEMKKQKKQKKQKKSLSLEDFQLSLMAEEPQQSNKGTSFAQKDQSETKGKVVLEEKTFSLVKEEKPVIQEQKVFKMQVIPKKQQQLIQESKSEGSESEEEDSQPIKIKCLESKNKFIQQICQLCSTNVAFQVNQQNWQQIDMNNGFRQSFQPLIEFTFKSIGEVGSYYLSFKDHTVCLSAENLSKTTNVDKVLKHFTGNQLTDYNSPIDIPVKSQPINFLLSAEYDSLLNGFSCRRFQIAIKTDLMYQVSKKNQINVKQIVFYKNRLKLKYVGLMQLNGITHQASFDQEEGGEMTNLVITSLQLPKEQGLIPNLVDKYVDGTLITDMLENSEQMTADLQIQTHHKNDEIGLTFNLRKRKGKQ